MKKRWGVRVIAMLMLIAGLLIFLLGAIPAVLMAFRGTSGDLEKYLAIPSVLGGCVAALPLLVVGSVLLTLGRISDNFAAVSRRAPVKSALPAEHRAEVAAAAIAKAPQTEASEAPTGALAVVVVAEKSDLREPETSTAVELVGVEGPVAASTAAEAALPRAIAVEAGVVAAEALAGPGDMAPAAEAALVTQAAEGPPPQEEIRRLQNQLASLQAQLDEMKGAPPEPEELPAMVEDEGPAPGATEALKLPGADDAARVAAEVAALKTDHEVGSSQEY